MNSRLTDSTAKAPDKGEIGGSSPPRPTVKISCKYAVILTFPLSNGLPLRIYQRLLLLPSSSLVYDNLKEPVMAALDWSQCPAVESIPGKVSGAWVFRGTRIPVATVFENLEAGASIEEIIEWFDLTREQVTAVLDFAARSLESPAHR
jgi:uncharacterized protein (DUF433 family)